jgi:HNH endonuclease
MTNAGSHERVTEARQIGTTVAGALLEWIACGKPKDEPIDSSGVWTPMHYFALYRCSPEGREAYYRSKHWLRVSTEQKRLEPNCAGCGSGSEDGTRLEAHHLSYDYGTLGREQPGVNLQTLCWVCHALISPKSGLSAMVEAAEQDQRDWERWFTSLGPADQAAYIEGEKPPGA